MLHIKEAIQNEAVIGEKMVVNEQVIKLQTFDNNSRRKHTTVLKIQCTFTQLSILLYIDHT